MIGRSIEHFSLFMGPSRLRALILLIAITGLISLILNVIVNEYDWVRPAQTILAGVAVMGAVLLVGSRMDATDRARWVMILAPAIGAFILGATVLQQFSLALFGAGLGWIFVGLFLFRSKTPVSYRKAIKALRRGELEEAVATMDALIRDEPDDINHYRFRAELLRLWGKLDRARRDYLRIIELEADSALAYNGLAEVDLQSGNFERALDAAKKAVELAPDDWVTLYNQGMIEDRLDRSDDVIEHLNQALTLKVPDARHRLLIHLYLLRAYARLGRDAEAAAEQEAIRKHKAGLEEWQRILESPEAEVLNRVLGADVAQARDLADGKLLPAAVI